MLNYKSVRSSEPQIRSNPALRHVSSKSGFQKRLTTLLEPMQLPFPTFQIVKEPSQNTLQQHQYYGWVRPAHLRCQWLVLTDDMPLMMVDPRDSSRMFSIRVPFDKFRVQQIGPLILEGAWDAQDHVLWIWDVVVWEKATVWNTLNYSKRWELVKKVVGEILDCGHPMSDAEVKVPTWETLGDLLKREEFDPATSVEFQPEKAGQRRQLFVVRDEGVKFKPTTHAERKMVADRAPSGCAIQVEEVIASTSAPTPAPSNVTVSLERPPKKEKSSSQQPSEEKKVKLQKDTLSKLPDTYRVIDTDGQDLGLAAIRSLGMSKELRELFKTAEQVAVIVRWYEPFQKYEVRQLDN
jgi:hypothetical protein